MILKKSTWGEGGLFKNRPGGRGGDYCQMRLGSRCYRSSSYRFVGGQLQAKRVKRKGVGAGTKRNDDTANFSLADARVERKKKRLKKLRGKEQKLLVPVSFRIFFPTKLERFLQLRPDPEKGGGPQKSF